MYWSFLKVLKPSESYYVENIKQILFWVQTQNPQIYEIVIFNQTTKIETHEEKYFRSK